MNTTLQEKVNYSLFARIPSWVFISIPVAATIVVWFGIKDAGFTPDDYLVLNAQSPIKSFTDVISMFWRHDPNPQYWRPLTDATISFDFWLWGWDPAKFHITNLIFHCIATVLVFAFSRRLFQFSLLSAGMMALIFGVSGSHDSNLLWIAARSDVIATILMIIVLLTAQKSEIGKQNSRMWRLVSYGCFFFALTSKEVSGVAIFLLPLLVYSSGPQELWRKKKAILFKLIPYATVAILFIVIRLQFTVPLSQMQPLTAEGSHSVSAFLKNFVYSVGYCIAPIDFLAASILIMRYAAWGHAAAATTLLILLGFVIFGMGNQVRQSLYKPFVLVIFTGIVSFQSFERWRVYFPSVGILAIMLIVFAAIWHIQKFRLPIRICLVLSAILFVTFHSYQATIAQRSWQKGTEELVSLSRDLQSILAAHPERPITIELITSPTKLGSAPLLQLSKQFFALKAEADVKQYSGLASGSVSIPGDSVNLETDVDVYALNPILGFRSLLFKKIGNSEYVITGDRNEIGLFPNSELQNGRARRDTKISNGEVFDTYGTKLTVETAEVSFASIVKMRLTDTLALHLYFDGEHIRELR